AGLDPQVGAVDVFETLRAAGERKRGAPDAREERQAPCAVRARACARTRTGPDLRAAPIGKDRRQRSETPRHRVRTLAANPCEIAPFRRRQAASCKGGLYSQALQLTTPRPDAPHPRGGVRLRTSPRSRASLPFRQQRV